ncbi:MAG: hypothetical protein AB8G22_18625 [Saprospiraceae bacterium]
MNRVATATLPYTITSVCTLKSATINRPPSTVHRLESSLTRPNLLNTYTVSLHS